MILYVCNTCKVLYFSPPPEGTCRLAHGRTVEGMVSVGYPFFCDGEVVAVEFTSGGTNATA